MTLGESAREARIAVNYLLQGEPIDWAVPVIYFYKSLKKIKTSLKSCNQSLLNEAASPASGMQSF